MREVLLENKWPDGARAADWNDVDAIFEGFDEQLAAYGLEVVIYETDSDTYVWTIEKKT